MYISKAKKKFFYFCLCVLNKGVSFSAVSILDPASCLRGRLVYVQKQQKFLIFIPAS